VKRVVTEDPHYGGARALPPGATVPIVRARPRGPLGVTVYAHVPRWQFPDGGQEEAPETNRLQVVIRRQLQRATTEDVVDLPIRGWRAHFACDEVEIFVRSPDDATITYHVTGGAYDGGPTELVQHIDFVATDQVIAPPYWRIVELLRYSREWRALGEGGLVFLGPANGGTYGEYIGAVAPYSDWTPLHRRVARVGFLPASDDLYCRLEVR